MVRLPPAPAGAAASTAENAATLILYSPRDRGLSRPVEAGAQSAKCRASDQRDLSPGMNLDADLNRHRLWQGSNICSASAGTVHCTGRPLPQPLIQQPSASCSTQHSRLAPGPGVSRFAPAEAGQPQPEIERMPAYDKKCAGHSVSRRRCLAMARGLKGDERGTSGWVSLLSRVARARARRLRHRRVSLRQVPRSRGRSRS